jgi:hypothetical protein
MTNAPQPATAVSDAMSSVQRVWFRGGKRMR